MSSAEVVSPALVRIGECGGNRVDSPVVETVSQPCASSALQKKRREKKIPHFKKSFCQEEPSPKFTFIKTSRLTV